jgi:hypothetical protein
VSLRISFSTIASAGRAPHVCDDPRNALICRALPSILLACRVDDHLASVVGSTGAMRLRPKSESRRSFGKKVDLP